MTDRATTPAASTATARELNIIADVLAENDHRSYSAIIRELAKSASQPVAAAPVAQGAMPKPWESRSRDGSAIADYRAMEAEIREWRERAALQQRQAPAPTGDAAELVQLLRMKGSRLNLDAAMMIEYLVGRAQQAEAAPVASAEPVAWYADIEYDLNADKQTEVVDMRMSRTVTLGATKPRSNHNWKPLVEPKGGAV